MKRTIAVFALLAAFVAPSQAQSLSEKLEEARLVARIQTALAEDNVLRAFTFRVTTAGDVATVFGAVETPEQRDRVAAVVGTQAGVERVVNEVRVASGDPETAPELPPVEDASETTADAEELEPEPEPDPIYHTVRRGDTLGAIANRYGVAVTRVRQLNGISGSRIRAGQRLRVK